MKAWILSAALLMLPLGTPALAAPTQKVTITLHNVPVGTAVVLIAKTAGMNVVVPQALVGHHLPFVSLSLHDIDAKTALRTILAANGLTYKEVDGLMVVMPAPLKVHVDVSQAVAPPAIAAPKRAK